MLSTILAALPYEMHARVLNTRSSSCIEHGTPLHHAVGEWPPWEWGGHEPRDCQATIVRTLLSLTDVDVNAADANGETTITLTHKYSCPNVVRQVLRHDHVNVHTLHL